MNSDLLRTQKNACLKRVDSALESSEFLNKHLIMGFANKVTIPPVARNVNPGGELFIFVEA